MLEKIEIINFRCFSKHTIPFRKISILVGKNNAGKSTVIEALRLVSIISQRYQHAMYKYAPEWTKLPKFLKGITPNIRNMDFNSNNIFHRYGNPPAEIIAYFKSGKKIHIFINHNFEIFSLIYSAKEKIISAKSEAERYTVPSISVLPQIAPLSRNEEYVKDIDYVQESVSSSLASLHFRNQIKIYNQYFQKFKNITEKTWDRLEIVALEVNQSEEKLSLSLLIRDADFVSEIAWMGHGLQMWLQTMWFLARCQNTNSIIMDEPDVYMHADLQKKLIRLVKEYNKQIIIATHSIEIMSEVDPSQILVIDRAIVESKFVNNMPGLQEVIDSIGGTQNLQISKLWNSRKCLIVEGKDIQYLKRINDKLNPGAEALDSIPNFSISGWGGWNNAIGSKLAIKNTFDERINVYCIFDRDYHTDDEIKKRIQEAKEREIKLHIWRKKEIENYLIIPEVLFRIIQEKNPNPDIIPNINDLKEKLLEITRNLEEETMDKIAQEYFSVNRSGLQNANKIARTILKNNWDTLEAKTSIISGKEVIRLISEWCSEKYGFTLNPYLIIQYMHANEVNKELISVLANINSDT